MKKRIFSILMVVVMTIALVACGTAQSSPDSEAVETVKEVVESADTENSEAVSEPEQATEAPVSLVADNVAIDGEFGDATGITVEKLDVAECEAFASYITDKTTAQAVFDIGLTDADKNAVQPDGTVNVTITVPDEMIGAEGDNYLVYFINADAFSQVEVVSVTSDTVTFETEHFSVYAVVKFDSNVMSETDFVRNSEEIAENSEAVSTPETSTEENSEAVSEPDSEAVVEPEFTVTELNATKYATQSVNVRSGPSTDYDKIGGLTTNQEVQVTGQANTGWWRIQYNGGEAYVSDKYLADEKVEKPAASETPSNGGGSTANSGSAASNSCPYTLWQPVDEGSKIWWYVTQPDPNWETSGHKETQAWMMDTICDRGVANSGGFVPEGYYGYAANEWIFMGTYSEGNVYYQSFYYATISQSLVN